MSEWSTILEARDEFSILARSADRAEFVTSGLSRSQWAVMLKDDAAKWRKAIVLAHRARKREERAR